jgi:putative addiction module component (TIGR02574 family)
MSKPALNINDLSPEERLRLIEEPWDSLNEKPESVPLTNAQREELDRRLDDLEHSGPEGIPWEQVLQQIRSRSKWSHRSSGLLPPRTLKTPTDGMRITAQVLVMSFLQRWIPSLNLWWHILNASLLFTVTHVV